MEVHIENSWKEILKDEFEKEYFTTLAKSVREAYLSPKNTVFPPRELIFNAFEHCHFNDVRVVILGQDPYHGHGQAHGLAFSVPEGVKTPPSLQNIFKELHQDTTVNRSNSKSSNLQRWADQGVLLLNSTLTVEASNAGSHQKLGWEQFTDVVIEKISKEQKHVVFLLWGAYAQNKGKNIDNKKHLVLHAPHPSPLSAYRGFFGCKHFSKTNEYLMVHNKKPVVW